MVNFTATLQQFASQGEKTGWTYIDVPFDLAEKLIPDNKKSFRVKGKLDAYSFSGVGLLPMGEGNFIMAINAAIRKGIKKKKGATVKVQMEVDKKEQPISKDLLECLSDEPKALKYFKSLAKSHQRYFSTWIDAAKTDSTKTKRITQSVVALGMGLSYSEMIRMNKKS